MNDLEKILDKLKPISRSINEIIKQSKYDKYDDLSDLSIDYDNPDQLLLLDELRGILGKLSDVKNDIDYLSRPIKYTSVLHKNTAGRYETDRGDYYTCSSSIEALVYDDYYEKERWVTAAIVHDNKDYYIKGYKDTPMDGLTVRMR